MLLPERRLLRAYQHLAPEATIPTSEPGPPGPAAHWPRKQETEQMASGAKVSAVAVRAIDVLNMIPTRLIGLVIGMGTADVFKRSGQTKVSGWQGTGTTVQLSRDKYKVPLLPPEI